MRRIVCFVLILILTAAVFTGCGEKKQLLGTWECTLDMSAVAEQLLNDQKLGGEFAVDSFAVTAQLTFLEDDTFLLTPDQEKLAASVDALVEDLAAGLLTLLQEQLQEQGLQVSVEELLQLSGLEPEDLTQQLSESFDKALFLESLNDRLTLEGFYRVKKDQLLFCADAETKLDDVYTLYTLEEGSLTLTTHIGENSHIAENPILTPAPVEFIRAQ